MLSCDRIYQGLLQQLLLQCSDKKDISKIQTEEKQNTSTYFEK